jgi:hypothetical protein
MCVATVIAVGATTGEAAGAGPKHALSATHVNSQYVNDFALEIRKYKRTSRPVLRTRKRRVSVVLATAESI